MTQAKKENGLENTQPKAPPPLGGGSGVNGTADIILGAPELADIAQHGYPEQKSKPHNAEPRASGERPTENVKRAHLCPRENEVTKPADGEPQTLAAYLRGWLDLYQWHQDRIGAGLGNELIHEDAGPLDTRSLSHD